MIQRGELLREAERKRELFGRNRMKEERGATPNYSGWLPYRFQWERVEIDECCLEIDHPKGLRFPPSEEIVNKINKMLAVLESNILWVNPDYGLKTRKYAEVKPTLTNMDDVSGWLKVYDDGSVGSDRDWVT